MLVNLVTYLPANNPLHMIFLCGSPVRMKHLLLAQTLVRLLALQTNMTLLGVSRAILICPAPLHRCRMERGSAILVRLYVVPISFEELHVLGLVVLVPQGPLIRLTVNPIIGPAADPGSLETALVVLPVRLRRRCRRSVSLLVNRCRRLVRNRDSRVEDRRIWVLTAVPVLSTLPCVPLVPCLVPLNVVRLCISRRLVIRACMRVEPRRLVTTCVALRAVN